VSAAPNPSRPPRSVTSFGFNMAGVCAALVTLFVFRQRHTTSPLAALVVCLAGVAPILALDLLVLKVHRRSSTGLDWSRPPAPDSRRVATKVLGLAATLAPFLLAYWLFPEYADLSGPFFHNVRQFGLSFVVLAVLYIWLVDGQMRAPRDAYWQLGRVFLGHRSDANGAEIADHYRGWLIKAFYLALFLASANSQLNGIIAYDLGDLTWSNLRLYHFGNDLIYALDVLYAAVGYVLSSRLFDSHLRSAEPTFLGWVVALECYPPFWGKLFSPQYLRYDGPGFEAWLGGHYALMWGWVAVVLGLEVIYVLATFAFGVRFSNLTNRGILTNGPYRFTKHPAYLAKNLSWWLITLPFVPYQGWTSAVKSSLCLGGVNFIYFLRARTEERHLSKDPTYVAYAVWMNEHGWLRFLNRVPFFRYVAPVAKLAPPGSAAGSKRASYGEA
jgi:protein-S-isoprenylcysteine O-methyltransferase Ste14